MKLRNAFGPLDYIQSRGYVSYSSLSNVWKNEPPLNGDEPFLAFGVELHSRFLEKKVINILSDEEEEMLRKMLKRLETSSMVKAIMHDALVEQEIKQMIMGIPFLGYIDVKKPKLLADLKSTKLTSKTKFIESLDFLQPVIYRKATGIKDFYFIGISKTAPHDIFTFNANDYPEKLKESENKLKQLITYVKENSNFSGNLESVRRPKRN